MCGLLGFLATTHSGVPGFLNSIKKAIPHRGPDDSGFWIDEECKIGLAHVRLSILELSEAGAQPMHSACGRYIIAFNGEIYNHLELRTQLEQQGLAPDWRGHSDTETLLACIVKWGLKKTLQATVGMFAIALWDKQEKVLTLARDRMGEKPLYWGWNKEVLLFGSELKALKGYPDFAAKIDRNALALLIKHNYIPAPYSIYEDIYKLQPGHYVQICQGKNAKGAKPIAYWSFNHVVEAGIAKPFQGTDDEIVDALETQLVSSVHSQMLADVPLGAFLSGGVDSSTIVALMQSISNAPIKTFAIGFNEPKYNEAEYAKEVAKHLGTEHTELYVDAADAMAVITKLPQIFCEPFADSSQIPTFLVSKMTKQHVTVALSGDAGDELFGGYNPYQFAPKIWGLMSKLPVSLRVLIAKLLTGLPTPEKTKKLLEVLPAKNRAEFYDLLMSHWKQPEQLVIGAQSLPTALTDQALWPQTDSFEHWMMALDAKQYMIDDVLVKVDRAAMANSLEVRVPMLDHRVVEFAWRIPLETKIRHGVGKWPLKELLYRHVPRELIERPKKGFSIPLGEWLRGPLLQWAEALLNEQRLQQEGYFYPQAIRATWKEHLSTRRDHSTKLWGVLMFQAWLENQ